MSSSSSSFPFPPWGEQGTRLQQWIENRTAPGCDIARVTMTMENLRPSNAEWTVEYEPMILEPRYQRWMAHWGFPVEEEIPDSESVYRAISIEHVDERVATCWRGFTGPGVVFLNDVKRADNSHHPFISEFTKTVYERDYPLEGLTHMFVTEVGNSDTISFIDQHIYLPGVSHQGIRTYDASHPEFVGLLGTRLGRSIGYFILGAFGQGVKRISQIAVFSDLEDPYALPHLLFVLEDIPPFNVQNADEQSPPEQPSQQKKKSTKPNSRGSQRKSSEERTESGHRVQKSSPQASRRRRQSPVQQLWRRRSPRLQEKNRQKQNQIEEEQKQGEEQQAPSQQEEPQHPENQMRSPPDFLQQVRSLRRFRQFPKAGQREQTQSTEQVQSQEQAPSQPEQPRRQEETQAQEEQAQSAPDYLQQVRLLKKYRNLPKRSRQE